MNKAGTFTQVDNTLLEKLYTSNLSGAEMRVMLFIIRQTAGFHRESHELSAGFIAKGTGLCSSSVEKSLSKLRKKGLIDSIYHHGSPSKIILANVQPYGSTDGEPNDDTTVKSYGSTNEHPIEDTTVKSYGSTDVQSYGGSTVQSYAGVPYDLMDKETKYKTKYKEKERKTAPTLEEIIVYCYKKGYSISAERFYEYYDRSGWRINGQPIDDWRKLADRWQETEYPKRKTEYVEPYEERRCTFNVDELYMLAENWIPPGE